MRSSLALSLFLVLTASVAAQTGPSSALADQFRVDGTVVRYSGNVQVRVGRVTVTADEVVYDRDSGEAELLGRVTMRAPEAEASSTDRRARAPQSLSGGVQITVDEVTVTADEAVFRETGEIELRGTVRMHIGRDAVTPTR